MIKFRGNRILLCGDTHGPRNFYFKLLNMPALYGNDIVHIGDFGLGFNNEASDLVDLRSMNKICQEKGINLYIIRGNHDDPARWNLEGGSNIFLVKDYTPAVFSNGKTALLVGGGVSIDRPFRKQGIDYWKDEATTYQKTDKKFNYLFAHDAPDYFNHSTESLKTSPYAPFLIDDKTLFADCLNQRNVISNIVADITPTHCFSGHFHNRVQEEKNGIKYRCLAIDEVIEFDSDKF